MGSSEGLPEAVAMAHGPSVEPCRTKRSPYWTACPPMRRWRLFGNTTTLARSRHLGKGGTLPTFAWSDRPASAILAGGDRVGESELSL